MSQPSPGPWKIVFDLKCVNGDLVPGIVSEKTGQVISWPRGRDDGEAIANGHLMAASVRLLEALENLRTDFIEVLSNQNAEAAFSDVMSQIRLRPSIVAAAAAIKKATGGGS